MFDCLGRKINYLRISVTDLCNLRCQYCMPNGVINKKDHSQILTFDEIINFVKVAISFGIDKVRLTGGEPLVRKGIVQLVKSIYKLDSSIDLCMTSNGILLNKFAIPLAKAGLKRVNISLDTIHPKRYQDITQKGTLFDVLTGIEAAKAAGLYPIKLNCVVKKSEEEPDAIQVKKFAERAGCQIRFIKEMNLEKGIFSKVIGGEGGDCDACNRLRLTSDGFLKPCLFSDIKYNIKQLGAGRALELAINNKPAFGKHTLSEQFYSIGG